MPARNLPIQVLSCCDTCGNLQPLRFRFEDREHSVHTVPSPRSSTGVRSNTSGWRRSSFLCKARLDGREKLYELRYTVATHRWTLAKEVY